MRNLLEKVRVDGYVQVPMNGAVESIMPFIYQGDCSPDSLGALHYWNSGGRNILFEMDGKAYKLKGVDPFAHLTRKVANSEKNLIHDVVCALNDLEKKSLWSHMANLPEGFHDHGKPFGVATKGQAENERITSEMLSEKYHSVGLANPCEFLKYEETGIERGGEATYQILFRLPRKESDLRLQEFQTSLVRRLDACSDEEIADKSENIIKLYNKFMRWIGYNSNIFIGIGMYPLGVELQNWAISEAGDGYGLFRIDHGSTERKREWQEIYEEFTKKVRRFPSVRDVPYIIDILSFLSTAVKIASEPEKFLPPRTKYDPRESFSRLSPYSVMMRSTHLIRPFRASHEEAFLAGLDSDTSKMPKPIHEKMLLDALE
jgi:hypothetical protein